jgi:hypothetical protein
MKRETQPHFCHIKSALNFLVSTAVFELITCLCKIVNELFHSPRNRRHTHPEPIVLIDSCVAVCIRNTYSLVTIQNQIVGASVPSFVFKLLLDQLMRVLD